MDAILRGTFAKRLKPVIPMKIGIQTRSITIVRIVAIMDPDFRQDDGKKMELTQSPRLRWHDDYGAEVAPALKNNFPTAPFHAIS